MDDAVNGINPRRVFHELSRRLPDNCILSADSGSTASWYAQHLRFRRGMMGSLSGNLATMGPGVPYAIAEDFSALPRDIRESVDVLARFGPVAVVKRRGATSCAP